MAEATCARLRALLLRARRLQRQKAALPDCREAEAAKPDGEEHVG